MIPKPDDCIGCPMYGDGQGFVPDKIPADAEVLFLWQNPGKYEEAGLKVVEYDGRNAVTVPHPCEPVIGPTGYQLEKSFLPLAGLDSNKVGKANVLRCRMQKPTTRGVERTDEMPTGETLTQAVAHCSRAYLRVPPSVRLIVAQGAHAWEHLGGPKPLTGWRGHLAPTPFEGKPVLATVHLADLRHRPKLDVPTRRDFTKIRKILAGTWPLTPPPILSANTCSYEELTHWFVGAQAAPFMVIDTEYDPGTKTLILVGLGYPGMTAVLQYEWFGDSGCSGRRTDFLYWLRKTTQTQTTVFHNLLADISVLRSSCNMDWSDYKKLEDTMQAHHVLWCEWPHTLEFVASMDGQHPKAKHLAHTDLKAYNRKNVLDTISSWEARLEEFKRDPLSHKVYHQVMAVLPHLDRSMLVGIAVDQEKVPPAIQKYRERVIAGDEMARAYCGWPINLRSDDQMKTLLYEVERMPVKKHPETKQVTTNASAVAELRSHYLPFDALDDEMYMDVGYIKARVERGGHPLLEAYVLHAHADHILGHYLLPLVEA